MAHAASVTLSWSLTKVNVFCLLYNIKRGSNVKVKIQVHFSENVLSMRLYLSGEGQSDGRNGLQVSLSTWIVISYDKIH